MVNVAFKMTGFRFPSVQDGPLDILDMVEKDKTIMAQLETAGPDEKPELLKELSLPPVIEPYLSAEKTSTLFFDILTDEEFGEQTIETSKLDLKKASDAALSEKDALAAENARLKEKLAELEKETDLTEPKTSKKA